METLGKRIKYLRERSKISQIDFAKKIGVSNAVLSRYESGDRKPDYDTLQLIADFFEVSTDYLLGRTDTPLSPVEQDEADFQTFKDNPKLNVFYKELPESEEEAVERLREIWEIIKHDYKKK
ncbi:MULTISPECIES: helix-turn-helix domain-containing protein [Lysinibacillus]|uniref:helix-turn-helix domain-containing protein n=1 Tax=Lysinibacillus TaxID=400634 RepID=UPI00214C3C28|nr:MULTISPECIES: helix-turn-helix transcriptional regulator [Lysinibacillus]UUV26067.1 helix-turn-helix transcriptional regulator [Lysinibacillus sp. FN11]UYB48940.1 helix-turn-helix transcriptional regulator [Lysinibacillus capsici]